MEILQFLKVETWNNFGIISIKVVEPRRAHISVIADMGVKWQNNAFNIFCFVLNIFCELKIVFLHQIICRTHYNSCRNTNVIIYNY